MKWSKVKEIAKLELGYTEGPNNWTKYAQELDAIKYFNYPKQNVAWCGTFDYWCIWIAADRSKEEALRATYQPKSGNCACGCKYGADYFRKAGKFFSTPKEGDIAFFGKPGQETHQGFVSEVLSDVCFISIEGNCGNKVASNRRKVSECSGFGRPDYEVESATSDSSSKTFIVAGPITDPSVANKIKDYLLSINCNFEEQVGAARKTNEEIAREVIDGLWKNSPDRKRLLEAAGYNYNDIQSLVNKILKGG